MTETSTKRGMLGKAVACACGLALAASLTPAAALSAFAVTPAPVSGKIKVVVQDGASVIWTQDVQVGGSDPDVAAISGTVNTTVTAPEGTDWYVDSSNSYVAFDDVIEAAGASRWWNSSVLKLAITGTGTNAAGSYVLDSTVANTQSTYAANPYSYFNNIANQNYYPEAKTAVDTGNTSGNKTVTPCFSLNTNETQVTTTAADAAKRNAEKFVAGDADMNVNGLRFMRGISKKQFEQGGDNTKAVNGAGITVYLTVPKLDQRVAGKTWADTMFDSLAYNTTFNKNAGAGGGIANFVVATSNSYHDALAASGLAGALGAPIIITDSGELTPQAATIINHIAAPGANFYIMGGQGAISSAVTDQIAVLRVFTNKATGKAAKFDRVEGKTAWDTSVTIQNYLNAMQASGAAANNAIIATSNSFQDALSIASYAYKTQTPIILTNENNVLSDTALANVLNCTSIYVLGGKAAVSEEVTDTQLESVSNAVTRIWGQDCFETSSKIATNLNLPTGAFDQATAFNGSTNCVIATANDYYDALSAAAWCGTQNKPGFIVLVSNTMNNSTYAVSNFLAAGTTSVSKAGTKFFGGTGAVNSIIAAGVNTVVKP